MAPSHGDIEEAQRHIDHINTMVLAIDYKVVKALWETWYERVAALKEMKAGRSEIAYAEYQLTRISLLLQYTRWYLAARQEYRKYIDRSK